MVQAQSPLGKSHRVVSDAAKRTPSGGAVRDRGRDSCGNRSPAEFMVRTAVSRFGHGMVHMTNDPSFLQNSIISVIIPIYDEEEGIEDLFRELLDVLDTLTCRFEVIAVNDGSRDASITRLKEVAARRPEVKVVDLRRNYGQTAAMMAGIEHASGEVIVSIDADLQNDPRDILALLKKLEEGYDVVSGWRKDRQDDALRRNLPSRVANAIISRISGVPLHDYRCTLKAYHKDVIKGVRLYGEMHRFIPIYAKWMGARICEIPVNHRPRRWGRSKYVIAHLPLA